MIATSLLLLALGGPAQAPAPAPAPAAAPAPAPAPAPVRQPAQVRPYRTERPTPVRFSVPTSAGPIKGTVLADVEGRALDGWGRFELKITVDPASVRTGDSLRDRVISRRVLAADRGPLVVGSVTWLKPDAAEAAPDAPLPGAGAWVDAGGGRKYLELRYAWEGDPQAGTLRIEHEATLRELGLEAPEHPFVEVSGPVTLSLEASLVRER